MGIEKDHKSEPGDLPGSELIRAGDRALEWIAGYLDNTRDYPVMANCDEGAVLDALPECMPEEGEPLEKIEEDFRTLLLPAVTHWNHPCFFAYFSVSGSVPGILGELYSAALNTNGMKWITCPASAELEKGTLRWLSRALGLPDDFDGILADAASTSTLLSLAVAREKITGFNTRLEGWSACKRPLRMYVSEEAHSSMEKAAILLGVGLNGVRRIPSDQKYRMDTARLREMIREDRANGFLPFAVVATAGTTATNSVDPMMEIAEIVEKENLWFHVDAAYAGVAALLSEKRELFAGWERADTIVVNPHKWLFTPIDASAFFYRDAEAFRHTFSIVPEYLRTEDDADNPMDYGFQLGRRFRSLKLWFVLRAFGRKGLEERIRHHIDLAHRFAGWVDNDPVWERLAPTPFSTVCFRFRGASGTRFTEEELTAKNAAIMKRINESGEAYLSHSVLKGRYSLRLAIGNIRTTSVDVERFRQLLMEAAAEQE